MIRFPCPACGKRLGIPEIHAGKQISVPICWVVFSSVMKSD